MPETLTETATPETTEKKVQTYIHKVKCRSCGLHFMPLSWERDWHARKLRFCPECGEKDSFIVWSPEERKEFIFQFVPGPSATPSMWTWTPTDSTDSDIDRREE